MKSAPKFGVTLLELLVVLVVLALLATISVGVYGKEILRAKYARARVEIRTLEIAITQYEIDTGQLPPSGSGLTLAPAGVDTRGFAEGSGYLQVALRSSLNGQPFAPLSPRWGGPYVDWDYNRLGTADGTPTTDPDFSSSTSQGLISFLDPFGFPYQYIRASDYSRRGGTELPSNSPFAATETWYGPSTFQIISVGADGETLATPERGLDNDDVTNFVGPRQ